MKTMVPPAKRPGNESGKNTFLYSQFGHTGCAFGLTGIWSAGRKIIVVLAPPDQIGQYFGLYGITIRLSVFGAVVYSSVSDAYGSKPAMLTQSAQLLIGMFCLFMVRLPAKQIATTK